MSGRRIFIGDIHGCILELKELAEKLALNEYDRVFCLGDFMDKGPDSAACVQYARRMGFFSVKGNHDDSHHGWRKHYRRRLLDPKYKIPSTSFPPKREEHNLTVSEEDIEWLGSLPPYIRVDDTIVAVHGGLLPNIPLIEQPKDKIMRTRWVNQAGKYLPTDYDNPTMPEGAVHWTQVYDGPYHVVYGHEPHSVVAPRVDRRPDGITCYGIDTACVYGGRLTALVFEGNSEEPSIVQVQAKAAYYRSETGAHTKLSPSP